jgi:hypothetical protein
VTISTDTKLDHVSVSWFGLLPELFFVFIYIFSTFSNGFEPKLMSVVDTPEDWSFSDSDGPKSEVL